MKNTILLIFLVFIGYIDMSGQDTNCFYSDITRSYTNQELTQKGFMSNDNYLVSNTEYNHYSFFKKYGVVKAYRLGVDHMNSRYKTIHYYCQMIEDGYIQLLANFDLNGQYIDAMLVAKNKIEFVNELDDGTYMYSTEKFFKINNRKVSVTDKVEKGGPPWDDTPINYHENTISYIINDSGLFIKVQ